MKIMAVNISPPPPPPHRGYNCISKNLLNPVLPLTQFHRIKRERNRFSIVWLLFILGFHSREKGEIKMETF